MPCGLPSRPEIGAWKIETRSRCAARCPEPIKTSRQFQVVVPTIMGCEVGADEPASGSTVMAKVLASTPAGRGGLITAALPRAFGLKIPAGMGAPLVGISHNS